MGVFLSQIYVLCNSHESCNIIKIHNNVTWDGQYSIEYSCMFSTFNLNVGTKINKRWCM